MTINNRKKREMLLGNNTDYTTMYHDVKSTENRCSSKLLSKRRSNG
jgi:hypothetical protein